MLRRFFVLVALMLFGPLFVEVFLYHPEVALAHDPMAIFPRVVLAAAVAAGFLLLAADVRITAALFASMCGVTILAGVIGTAIHLAIHAPSLVALAGDPRRLFRGRRQPPEPPVGRVGPPLDKAAPLEPVGQPRHGHRLDLQDLREILLRQARIARELEQHHPLRPGEIMLPGALVGLDPAQPRDVMQQNQKILFGLGPLRHLDLNTAIMIVHSVADSKMRYD